MAVIENGVIRQPGFYSMKKLPAEQREMIPGGSMSSGRLYSIVGIEGYDRLVGHGLTAFSPNGKDYWFWNDDVLAIWKKYPTIVPHKRRSRKQQTHHELKA